MGSNTPDKRALIIQNGWSQGSVVKLNDVVEHILCTTFDPSSIKAKYNAHLMIISQDCDIVSSELQVECLLMKHSKKTAAQLHNGNNPRKIQLEPIFGNIWEIKADDILILSKDALLTEAKEPVKVSPEQLSVIKQWKANRYTRTGLPEKFVELTRSVFTGTDEITGFNNSELIKRFSTYIASIRVYCKELVGKTQCGFILLYKDKKCIDDCIDYDALEELFDTFLLEPLRGIEHIELINDDESKDSIFEVFSLSDVMSDMEFSLGAAQLFPRYYFDYISFAEKEIQDNLKET